MQFQCDWKIILYNPDEREEACIKMFITVLLVAAPKPKGAKLKLTLRAEEWDPKWWDLT